MIKLIEKVLMREFLRGNGWTWIEVGGTRSGMRGRNVLSSLSLSYVAASPVGAVDKVILLAQ